MHTTLRGPFSGTLIHQLERLFQHGTAVGLSEGELLERFVRVHDESAFEALIARHGPMVLGVCRQLLRDPNDVDDAFQATFLVLVRKAGTLRQCELLGNWLYGVAHRVAMKSRAGSARRSARAPFGIEAIDQLETSNGYTIGDSVPRPDPEPLPWLHEEVRRLPEKYRVPVLLCYFEGLTHEQAAARLGWPIGTVKGRMARARDLLRKRLSRRGVTLPAAAVAAHLAGPDARAAVAESLKNATLNAARAIAGTPRGPIALTSAVSVPVATLADGVLRTMITTNVKTIAVVLLFAGAMTTGIVIASTQGAGQLNPSDSPAPAVHTESNTSQTAGANVDPQTTGSKKPDPATKKNVARAGGEGQGQDGGAPAKTGGMGGIGLGGGAGMMMSAMGTTDAGAQRELQRRLQITQLAMALSAQSKDPGNQAMLKKLDQPLTMSFASPTPLEDVLKYIKSALAEPNGKPIPIYVDPKGLEQAQTSLNKTVRIDLDGVPLKMSLRLVLKQLGLAYCVRDGVLIISSVEGIREELAEAASELLGNNPDKLEGMIQSLGSDLQMGGGGMGMM
jgi:RNA polymerase sigma factor (sigma-70 family)